MSNEKQITEYQSVRVCEGTVQWKRSLVTYESWGMLQTVRQLVIRRRAAKSPVLQLAVWLLCLCSTVRASSADDYWDQAIGIPGPDGPVRSVLLVGDTVYVAGRFSQIGGVFANSIAKFDSNGWSALGGGITVGLLPSVFALAYHEGQLYVGGAFGQAGNIPVNNIARWDGTNWFSCADGVGALGNGIVRAMAVGGDELIVGGTFNFVGELNTPNIAVWDGTNWAALGNGISGTAVDSVAASGTSIYAGGRFRLGGGVSATNVAMWNGTTWLALGAGIRDWDTGGGGGGMVRTLVAAKDGLVAGGTFRLAGAVSAINIAKWDGVTWRALASGMEGTVYSLALNGSALYAAGNFGFVGSVVANDIARWDGIEWSPLGSGIGDRFFSATVLTLAAHGSELFVGGGDRGHHDCGWQASH